jgi:hypothetical protein
MTASFTWEARPARVLCGRGYLDRIAGGRDDLRAMLDDAFRDMLRETAR